MKNYKIFRLLKTLSQEEVKEFNKFLKFKYKSSNSQTMRLFDYLIRYYPKFDDKKLSSECIYGYLFPGECYNDKRLRERYSDLVLVLEEYFPYLELKNDRAYRKLFLLKQLKKRNLEEEFKKYFLSQRFVLETENIKDEWHYMLKYVYDSEYYDFFDEHYDLSKANKNFESYSGYIDNLVYFFLIAMMKAYIKLFMNEKILTFNHSFKFMDIILSFIKNEMESFDDSAELKLYYDFLLVLKSPREGKNFHRIKSLLNSRKDKIPFKFFKELYIQLYNYCKNLQSKGDKEFAKESMKMITEMLSNGIFIENDGRILEQNYTNIAASAVRLYELDWAEEFINIYKDRLPAEFRNDAYNYNYSVIHYMRGYRLNQKEKLTEYDKALEYLSKVKNDSYYYYTRLKNHYLKIYYEIEAFDEALSLIDTYRHYLLRNNFMPQNLKQRYLNLINFVHKLIKIKGGKSKINLDKLNENIEKCDNLAFKGWLLERMAEVKD